MNGIARLCHAAACAASVSMAFLAAPAIANDTGSRWFDQYTTELGQRLQLIYGDVRQDPIAADNGTASFDSYVAETNQHLYPWVHADAYPAGTAMMASSLPPGFSAYLAYLAQRLDADAGKPGPVMGLDTGSARFDRYVDELNYRLQTMRQASDSTGF